jgi:uncharacterized membrane protein YbhN (UPF0104 family)
MAIWSMVQPARRHAVRLWPLIRVMLGITVLAIVITRQGDGALLAGIRSIRPSALLAAAAVTVVTTAAAAARWSTVGGVLGVRLRLPGAMAAYYRSQLLNGLLPGGVAGDVERAMRHGSRSGARGPAIRSVVWERSLGQAVQLIILLGVVGVCLVVDPGLTARLARGVDEHLVFAVLGALFGAVIVTILLVGAVRRLRRTALADLRGLLHPAALVRVVWLSALVVAGHVLVLVIAARAVGVTAPVRQLLPLTLLILVASAVPTNIGGWGPREGAASWLFAVAGLGAGPGFAASTAYGVLTLVAVSPGIAVLLADRRRTAARARRPLGGTITQDVPIAQGVAVDE